MSQHKPEAIRTYLNTIGRVPFLSKEEEIEYGQKVQRMVKVLELKSNLTKQLNRQPTFVEWSTSAQITEYELNQILQRGKYAKNQMLQANLRLVVKIAKQYQNRGLELLDLIQEGSIGLTRAVDKFDPTFGFKFSTYAYWWIRQGITRALAQKSRPIRLPVHITETLNTIKKTQRHYSQQLGRAPNVLELADTLGKTPKQIEAYLQWMQPQTSLSERVGEFKETELSELIKDPSCLPEERLHRIDLELEVSRILCSLTPQQQQVIAMRFGLDDGVQKSLAQVGDRIKLSRGRVRQIEQKVLNKLKQSELIREYNKSVI